MIKLEGGFVQNLGRVYGLYTLGFLGFVILMAILEALLRPLLPRNRSLGTGPFASGTRMA